MRAVIQSGGKGTRLRPYTTILPKPLMPVGTKPVLELLLRWLRQNDMREVYITTGHLGHLIRSFNGDVLTDLNLNAFVDFHRQHGGPLTIATARRSMQIDFGVLEDSDGRVTR